MTVKTYTMVASNGKKIRKATMVITDSGTPIKFTELLSKKEALRQSQKLACSTTFNLD